jgi:hypothetical protein
MGSLTRAERWQALEAVWCEAADVAARHAMGAIAWQSLGACGARTDLPWTAEPEDVGPWDAEAMRSVCAECPVLAECSAYVDRAAVVAGWWAGSHQDPDYVPPAEPGWVTVRGLAEDVEAWQGVLPLGGVA